MQKLELFIAHTPLQLKILEQIILLENSQNNKIVINDIIENYSLKLHDINGLIELKTKGEFKKIFKNIGKQKQVLEELYKEFESYDKIEIYLDDLYYPLCNYMYGFWKMNKEKVDLINFPEGILNIIEPKLSLKNYFNQTLKIIYSRFISKIPYYFYTQASGKKYCKKIYTLEPKLLERNEQNRCVKLKMDSIKINKNFKNAVILGQEGFLDYMPKKIYIELIKEQIEKLKLESSGKIYYKSHHQKKDCEVLQFLRSENILLIEKIDPIETLIEEYEVNVISTFVSSALIQLKINCGENIRCISYKMDIIFKYFKIKKNYLEDLIKIYNKLEIEIFSEND